MNWMGAGLASLAITGSLITALPERTAHPKSFVGAIAAAAISGILGILFFAKGVFNRTPTVDIHQSWNATYDKLRNDSDRFIMEARHQWTVFRAPLNTETANNWQDYVPKVPIPRVQEGPLYALANALKNHPSEDVRTFFAFAERLGAYAFPNEYRRYAVRTYDWLYKARESKEGFARWMEEEEVSAGAEDLVVILAYMEIGRAGRVKIGKTATHLGFWHLAEEWHPNVMALPKQ